GDQERQTLFVGAGDDQVGGAKLLGAHLAVTTGDDNPQPRPERTRRPPRFPTSLAGDGTGVDNEQVSLTSVVHNLVTGQPELLGDLLRFGLVETASKGVNMNSHDTYFSSLLSLRALFQRSVFVGPLKSDAYAEMVRHVVVPAAHQADLLLEEQLGAVGQLQIARR